MSSPGFTIVHEDADLLVVDKPADLVVHPSKDGEWSSLVGRVRLYLGHAEGRLVNRLDRETSGLVVVAKSADVARELGRLFSGRAVTKRYLAIVHGTVTDDERRFGWPLGDDEQSPVAIKACVRDDGAVADTEIRVVRRFERGGAPYSLLEVQPSTGRKHQIRVHLAHAGHSIVGDKLYGHDERCYLRLVDRQLTEEDRVRLQLPTHALHAHHLSWSWRGRDWPFEAEMPRMFTGFLNE